MSLKCARCGVTGVVLVRFANWKVCTKCFEEILGRGMRED